MPTKPTKSSESKTEDISATSAPSEPLPFKLEGLTPGRIVHYIDIGARHRAAVITYIYSDEGTVNLFVFDDGVAPLPEPVLRSVRYDENMQPLSWHWIEKA